MLTLGVCLPVAAQTANRPFADLGRHLQRGDTVFVSDHDREETPAQVQAPLLTADVFSTPQAAPAAQERAAIDSPTPVVSLSALSSRVKPFETIYVRKVSGEDIAGTFSRASEASLTMQVDGKTRDIPVSDVQQVYLRGGNRVKQGMLFGFLAGATIADIAFISSSGSDSVGAAIFVGTVAGGGAGLIWGALIGAFVHERQVVYSAAAPTVRVMPVLTPDPVGVMASVQF
jgi:hypothetical protein